MLLTTFYRSYEVIVEEVGRSDVTRKRRSSPNYLPINLTGYVDDDTKIYITADIRREKVPAKFKVGDGKVYNAYVNQPLKSETKYNIYVRAVAKGKEVKTFIPNLLVVEIPFPSQHMT